MKPALRNLAIAAIPLALLAGASTASAGLAASTAGQPGKGSAPYPAIADTDYSSFVDVAVRWDPALLRRGGKGHAMKVRVVGRGKKGAPIVFGSKAIRPGTTRTYVVRVRVKKGQRGAFANARNVVVSTAHQWDSPDAGTAPNLSSISDVNLKGTIRRAQFSARAVNDCDVKTLGPNAQAAGCDFTGANLAGMNLTGANLAGSILDTANLAGADLTRANLTGTSMVGVNSSGTNFGPTSQAAYTMPQAANPGQGANPACQKSGGGPMCDAIYSAKSTIGAVYYQFAGPNVTAWLQDAIKRGVDVFIIENNANTVGGTTENPLCQHTSDQKNVTFGNPLFGNRQAWINDPTCAWSPKADPFYALEHQLKMAVGPGTGSVRVQFASQNFNLTHQKSILVDMLDGSGKALSADSIAAAGGSAIVSTGNMQAYPNGWGQRTMSVKDPATQNSKQQVVNVNYLTSPEIGCTFTESGKCDAEWTPRDFAMKVTDPQILSRVAAVFASDLACDGADVDNVWNQAKGTGVIPNPSPKPGDASADWPETWSNGSVYFQGDPMPENQQPWQYPFAGFYPYGYFANFAPQGAPTYTPGYNRGNVRYRQLDLIDSAKKTLVVYNEEMSDAKLGSAGTAQNPNANYVVNRLIKAAQRGVQVTIVMANKFIPGTSIPDNNPKTTRWASKFDALLDQANYFGFPNHRVPRILLLDSEGALYIHGKAFIADGTDGWFGSINASTPSMNDNRELGLGVTNRSDGSTPAIPAVYSPQMISAVTTAATRDAAVASNWSDGQKGADPPAYDSGDSAQFPCINMQENPNSGLPPRDPANVAAPPQATLPNP